MKNLHFFKHKIDPKNLESLIANSIKASDKRYFFENYSIQARAVLSALKFSGYKIVPDEPTKEMIDQGVSAINLGIVNAKELAEKVYTNMVKNYKNKTI